MLSLWLIAAHMAGDYIFQNDWMASNKTKSWKPLLAHVAAYTACFVPVVLVRAESLSSMILFLICLAVMHFFTDARRWASGEKWPPKPIMVDQTLHALQLAILGELFLI